EGGPDARVAGPRVLRALPCTRSRRPRSAAVAAYWVPVAPVISGQSEPVALPPSASQRRHWYEERRGVGPVQPPVVTVSVDPTAAEPMIDGGSVLRGACATGVVVVDV